MKKLEFYRIGLITMVVLNLALVSFLIFNKPENHPHTHEKEDGHFKGRAIQLLDLDEEQQVQFEKLANSHHEEMISIERKQRELLRTYFKQLFSDGGQLNENINQQVSELDRQKLELTYKHFEEVKSILRPDQQSNFETFLSQAIGELLMDKKNPPPPRRNH